MRHIHTYDLIVSHHYAESSVCSISLFSFQSYSPPFFMLFLCPTRLTCRDYMNRQPLPDNRLAGGESKVRFFIPMMPFYDISTSWLESTLYRLLSLSKFFMPILFFAIPPHLSHIAVITIFLSKLWSSYPDWVGPIPCFVNIFLESVHRKED